MPRPRWEDLYGLYTGVAAGYGLLVLLYAGGLRKNNQLSNEKNLGCLEFIGDEILPSLVGTIWGLS